MSEDSALFVTAFAAILGIMALAFMALYTPQALTNENTDQKAATDTIGQAAGITVYYKDASYTCMTSDGQGVAGNSFVSSTEALDGCYTMTELKSMAQTACKGRGYNLGIVEYIGTC